MRRILTALVFVLFATSSSSLAQDSRGTPIELVRVRQPIVVDGVMNDEGWRDAPVLPAVMYTPVFNGQPTQRTEMRVVYDEANLYIGGWFYDSDPKGIRINSLYRDRWNGDDTLAIYIDAFNDNQNAKWFGITPAGMRFDALVSDDGNTLNDNWDGFWTGSTTVTSDGWFVEVRIPFSTLGFQADAEGKVVMGLTLTRLVSRLGERVTFPAIDPKFPFRRPSMAQKVQLRGVTARKPFYFTPYALAGIKDAAASPRDTTREVGADVRYPFTSNLTLDLTLNTDFAQVEADSQVINLSRFPILFPEERPFFLESSGIFSFGQFGSEVFYSRRIGLDTLGNPIPLDAGARLSGRLGQDQIGLLAVRTGARERAVDLVARVKHDVFARGYMGAIVTNQTAPGGTDRLTGGVDFSVPLYVGDQNLVFAAWGAGSKAGAGTTVASAWRVSIDFPNDLMDNFVSLGRIEPDFNPPLGFVRETDMLRSSGHFDIYPRPHALGVRRLQFSPLTWERTTHLDGSPSHALYELSPLGAIFESGDQFIINLKRQEDAPPTPFEIFRGQIIYPGDYYFNRAELNVTSSPGRPLSLGVTASAGDYYTGTATEVDATVTFRAAPHVIAQLEFDQLAARLATARFTARTARLRLDLAATPRFDTALFVQWDDESNRLTMNARLHWMPNVGSDAYLVWNSAWPTGLDGGMPWGRPARGALIGKLVYYFRL